MKNDNIEKRIVLITGAAGGIGEKIAIEFIKNNYCVCLNYTSQKSEEKLKELKNKFKNAEIELIKANIADSKQVQDMILSIAKKYNRIDVLVNNAGITSDNLAIRMSDEEFSKVIDTNLKGTFYCMREAVKIMMKTRFGKIINISSIVGLHGNAGQANYSASKAGIIGLTKSFAREYASRGILVNAIAPGAVETPMLEKLPENVRNSMIESIPLKRFADPAEIAELVYFLSNSNYITGQVVSIDGGMSI